MKLILFETILIFAFTFQPSGKYQTSSNDIKSSNLFWFHVKYDVQIKSSQKINYIDLELPAKNLQSPEDIINELPNTNVNALIYSCNNMGNLICSVGYERKQIEIIIDKVQKMFICRPILSEIQKYKGVIKRTI